MRLRDFPSKSKNRDEAGNRNTFLLCSLLYLVEISLKSDSDKKVPDNQDECSQCKNIVMTCARRCESDYIG